MKDVAANKETADEEGLSYCHVHGTPLATPPTLPNPKGDSTSDVVVSLVTQTLIPHYGM